MLLVRRDKRYFASRATRVQITVKEVAFLYERSFAFTSPQVDSMQSVAPVARESENPRAPPTISGPKGSSLGARDDRRNPMIRYRTHGLRNAGCHINMPKSAVT